MANHAFRIQNGKLSHQYLDEIAERESKADGYSAVNKSSKDLGRYQMGRLALRDADMRNTNDQWTGKFGVFTDQDFLKNKEAQEHAMEKYSNKNRKYLKNNKSYSYVGQEIDGIKRRFKITGAALEAASHRRGAGAVSKYLTHLKNNNMKSDFSRLEKKDWEEFEQIETRMREFENIKSWK